MAASPGYGAMKAPITGVGSGNEAGEGGGVTPQGLRRVRAGERSFFRTAAVRGLHGRQWRHQRNPTYILRAGHKQLLERMQAKRDGAEVAELGDNEHWRGTDSSGRLTLNAPLPLLSGRFLMEEVIGMGAHATVFRARDLMRQVDPDMPCYVAIKVMKADPQVQAVGLQECSTLSLLKQHKLSRDVPIANFITQFQFGGHLCIVMELLGQSIADKFNINWSESPLPCRPAAGSGVVNACPSIDVVRQMCFQLVVSLQHMHYNGIIHADLTPQNILLQQERAGMAHSPLDLKVKLADFGNAILFKNLSLYYNDFDAQSLLYRAPEVLAGLRFGPEIDMWSLGCIAIELFRGRRLFNSRSAASQFVAIEALIGAVPDEIYSSGLLYSDLREQAGRIGQFDRSALAPSAASKAPKLVSPSEAAASFTGSLAHSSGGEAHPMKPVATLRGDGAVAGRRTWSKLKRFYALKAYMGTNEHEFVSFVQRLLEPVPSERMSPAEALYHPFLAPIVPFGAVLPPGTTAPTPAATFPPQRLRTRSQRESLEVQKHSRIPSMSALARADHKSAIRKRIHVEVSESSSSDHSGSEPGLIRRSGRRRRQPRGPPRPHAREDEDESALLGTAALETAHRHRKHGSKTANGKARRSQHRLPAAQRRQRKVLEDSDSSFPSADASPSSVDAHDSSSVDSQNSSSSIDGHVAGKVIISIDDSSSESDVPTSKRSRLARRSATQRGARPSDRAGSTNSGGGESDSGLGTPWLTFSPDGEPVVLDSSDSAARVSPRPAQRGLGRTAGGGPRRAGKSSASVSSPRRKPKSSASSLPFAALLQAQLSSPGGAGKPRKLSKTAR